MAQTVIADDALVTDEYRIGLDGEGRIRISPIDVSQFIRLDHCERYPRLHSFETAERSVGDTPGVMTWRSGWRSCDPCRITSRGTGQTTPRTVVVPRLRCSASLQSSKPQAIAAKEVGASSPRVTHVRRKSFREVCPCPGQRQHGAILHVADVTAG
jgi:hypothetical protein